MLSVDDDVKAHGDILHVQIEPTVTINDVTAGTGAITNQALTPTEALLTVNLWKEATIDVVDIAQRQSIVDLLTVFSPAFGRAMGQQMEADLAALQSDVTTNVVGATTAPYDVVNPDLLTSAVQKLLDLDVPVDDPNDITWTFHTSQWPVLRKIKEMSDANLTGESVGGALKMNIPDIYGIPVFFSTRIVSSASTRRNLLYHRQAFAWGMQKNFNIEVLSRVRKSTPVSGDALYGVKTIRQNHSVLIHTGA